MRLLRSGIFGSRGRRFFMVGLVTFRSLLFSFSSVSCNPRRLMLFLDGANARSLARNNPSAPC